MIRRSITGSRGILYDAVHAFISIARVFVNLTRKCITECRWIFSKLRAGLSCLPMPQRQAAWVFLAGTRRVTCIRQDKSVNHFSIDQSLVSRSRITNLSIIHVFLIMLIFCQEFSVLWAYTVDKDCKIRGLHCNFLKESELNANSHFYKIE